MNPPLASVLLGLLLGSSPLAGPLFSLSDGLPAGQLPGELQLLVGKLPDAGTRIQAPVLPPC